jgi:ubiquinone/menaquinone biosynthesis C-methylase UbiE
VGAITDPPVWGDAVLAARAELRDALRVRQGSRILDAGCGAGGEVVGLARLVAPDGIAVGVDTDTAALEAAVAAARRAAVMAHFVQADAHHLPFPDGGFDGVRFERTLQNLDDPDAAIAEAARVLGPGGIVAAAEADWGSAVPNGGVHEDVPQPRIGLELPQRLERAGLAVTRRRPLALELPGGTRMTYYVVAARKPD